MSNSDLVKSTPQPLPEMAEDDPRRYHMNIDWVWSRKHNPELLKQATVRALVTVPDTHEFEYWFEQWAEHLHRPDAENIYSHGGWFCQREESAPGQQVLLFGSGGEDVAESLDFGIQWFSGAVLQHLDGATVTWQELPIL